MQISVSSTLTVYHDGQFWVGLAEHVEDGRYGVARIVFGAEDPRAGATGSLYNVAVDVRLNHTSEVTAGVRAAEAAALLTDFFVDRRP